MSNSLTTQLIVDGPRNTVIKVFGQVDTSDIAATGTIGGSGFTTTIGSNVVTFAAGALVPTLGQYVTFGDGTTTFNAGTYITGIVSATQITVSNVAKAANAAAAITITGTAGSIVLVDPAQLVGIDFSGTVKAAKFRIETIQFSIEDLLAVNLLWEATTNIVAESLTGRGNIKTHPFGGVPNNAGAGRTGKLLLNTQGWVAAAILSFTLTLELIKEQT